MLGNTKKVENTTLKELYITQRLSIHSETKKFTRHFTNTAFYLPVSDYVLFSWLVYYSDISNSFTYSAELLRMYDKASDRAIEIYGKDKILYSTSMTNARNSFMSLIEKGLIVKLSKKNQYMINPYMVCSGSKFYNSNKKNKEYLDLVNSYKGDDLRIALTKFCDNIKDMFDKELLRTNINLRKKNGKI